MTIQPSTTADYSASDRRNLAPLAYGALIGCTAIWGLNSHAVTIATQTLTPLAFLGLRFLIGAVTLAALVWLFGSSRLATSAALEGQDMNRRDLRSAALAGLLLGAAYLLQVQGFIKGDAILTVFLSSTSVLWVPVIVWISSHGKTKIPAANKVGVALSCVGIAMSQGFAFSRVTLEAVYALIASLAFAGEMVIVTRISQRLNSNGLARWMIWKIALIALGCFAAYWILGMSPTQSTPPKPNMPTAYSQPSWWIGALVFAGILATAIALYVSAWSTSIKRPSGEAVISATSRGIMENLDAPFTLLFGLLLFPWNTPISLWSMGLILVFSGVLWSEWPRKPVSADLKGAS